MERPRAHYRDLLARYLTPQWRRAVALALLLFTVTGLQLLNPLIIRRFIDQAMGGSAADTLAVIAAAFMVVAIATQAVSVAATYLSEQVGWTATNLLRRDLTMHCLRLDMPFHATHTAGELIERIDGDVTALANFFSQFVIRVLGSGLLLLGVLALTFREDARIGLALGAFVLVAAAVLSRIHSFGVPYVTADREAAARLFGFIEERLAGADDIRANGAGPHAMRGYYQSGRAAFRSARKAAVVNAGLVSATMLLLMLGYALALALGAYLYRAGEITLGTVYLLFQYTELLRRPLMQVTQQLREFQQAGAGAVRVRQLLDIPAAVPDRAGEPLPDGALTVAFDDVSFAYDDEGPVLSDISFRVEAGSVLGVLGRTGSGKTTLTRLLLRLYDPTSGTIRLGDIDTRAAGVAGLRQRVGVVTQDIQLFQATVRENLTLFDSGIPDDHIIRVLTDLGLDGWLASLAGGLDTELEPAAGGLSAGEAQLLAFARVFLRDPGLVILDEASSRLDPATERLIERAVGLLLSGRTGIIIAHRLATVQRVDHILILEDGRIAEQGTRRALAADPRSRFSGLPRAESGGAVTARGDAGDETDPRPLLLVGDEGA